MNTAFNNVLAVLASRLLTLFWQISHKTCILGQHNYMHELFWKNIESQTLLCQATPTISFEIYQNNERRY